MGCCEKPKYVLRGRKDLDRAIDWVVYKYGPITATNIKKIIFEEIGVSKSFGITNAMIGRRTRFNNNIIIVDFEEDHKRCVFAHKKKLTQIGGDGNGNKNKNRDQYRNN